uniref:GlcG protein n=1 Tax=Prymnesium polylepis TaxID=72548 RepID=A0A7S4HEV8_9EUKA
MAPDLALAKATTCVGFHMSSRVFKDSYINSEGGGPKMPQALAMGAVAAAVQKPVASFPGGVLCRDAANNVVGAIGVSGARSDEDEHCAILGAQAVGLVTEPAKSALQ